MKTSESMSGFSMLELVVSLAMAAVLAAYAVPSYRAYVARGHRIDAVMALHRAAQVIAGAEAAGTAIQETALALPPDLSRVPAVGRLVYRLELLRASDARGGYELRAIPAADGPMRSDTCGTFVLDGLGVRSNLTPNTGRSGDGVNSDQCWAGRAT